MKETSVKTNTEQDVLKDIIKKSFDAKGIKIEELLENAKDYETKNLIHSLTSDTKLSFKHFKELLKLADLQFSLSIMDNEVPPKFYTIYKSSTDQTRCVKFDSLGVDSSRDTNMDFHDEDELIPAHKSQDSSWVVGEYDGDFLSTDDYDENYSGFNDDVMDAISDDDNKSMEDRVDTTPEEELTPDEKKQAADDIAPAKNTEEALDYFMDEVRNYDPEILANCFPKNLPGDMFNSTAGQHELGQLQIQFSCINYESPQINEVAKALLNKYRNFRCL